MTSIFGNICATSGGDSGGGSDPEVDPLAWKLDGNSFTSSERKLGTLDEQDVRLVVNDADRLVLEEDGDLVVSNNSVLHSRRIDMTKVERFTNVFTDGITFTNDRTEADISLVNTTIYTQALILYDSLYILSAEIKILDAILNTTTLHIGCATADQSSNKRPSTGNRQELTITGLAQNDILRIEIDQTDDLNRTLNLYKNDILDQTTPISLTVASYQALRIYIYSDASSSNFSLGTVIADNESNVESSIRTTQNFRMLDINEQKFMIQQEDQLELLSTGVENFIVNDNNDLITANSATIHNRSIDQNLQERYTDHYKPGEGIVNFSNSQTKTTNVGVNVANYSVSQVFNEGGRQEIKWEVRYNPGASDIFKFGICARDDSYLKTPLTFDSATLTGLVKTDIIEVRFDTFEEEFTYYLNGVSQGTFTLTIPYTNPWRWFIQSDAGSSEFQLTYLRSPSQVSDEGIFKCAPSFSMKDFNNNNFLEHKNQELKLGSGSTTDVIRIEKPIEGSVGQEFVPYDVSLTAMGANIEFEVDPDEDAQVINVLAAYNSSAIPNILPFRPDINYEQQASIQFTPNHTVTNSATSIGIGFYSTVPLNYSTASGDPSSLYGSNYFMIRSNTNDSSPASLPSNIIVTFREPTGSIYSWALNERKFTLTCTPGERNGQLGYQFNWLYGAAGNVRLLGIFCEALDQNNPQNTNFEMFIHQPSQGTYTFDTDLSTNGSIVEIQGYEVKTEFDRLIPYEYNKFNIEDSASIGILTDEDYVIDFDSGSNNDFTITQTSDTEVNIVKASNTNFSISYSQNPINVSKYNWVIECIRNLSTGSNMRLQFGSIQYVPTVNAEAFSDGEFGNGYSVNFRPGAGTNYSDVSVLNGVATTDEIVGNGASLDRVRYTITNGVLTAEHQLSTDLSYQPNPIPTIDLLEGQGIQYYLSLNDSQTNVGSFDCNVIITRTLREIETPSIQLNDNSVNVINFQGDLEIKSNAIQYMDMADSNIMLNQPLMLHSGDYAYMYSLPLLQGNMFWNSEASKFFICDGQIWNVPGETITVFMSNDNNRINNVPTDFTLTQQGYVLIPSANVDYEVIFSNVVSAVNIMGIVAHLPQDGIFIGSDSVPICLAVSGYWDVAVEADTYTRDDYLSSTAQGLAYEKTGTSNTFAISSASVTIANDGDKLRAWLHSVD